MYVHVFTNNISVLFCSVKNAITRIDNITRVMILHTVYDLFSQSGIV